jgi:hypothetical protein
MKYVSVAISMLLILSFLHVFYGQIDGRMTGTAGLGRALLLLMISAVCIGTMLVHLVIIAKSLWNKDALSPIYLISAGLPVIPVVITLFLLFRR